MTPNQAVSQGYTPSRGSGRQFSSCDFCVESPLASQVVLVVKNPLARVGNIRDVGSVPGLGRSPGLGPGNPLHYSCLENPIDRGATVHRVAKSPIRTEVS